jgi:ubiquinone/menaquinone biosynthesis C-methylase UbiE
LLQHAHERSRAELVQGDFRQLPFGNETFDGVVSIAAFLHASRGEAPRILSEVARVLVPGGLLVTTIKAGHGEVVAPDGRRFVYHTPEAWREMLESAGMDVISQESTELSIPSLTARPWLTTTSRKS